MKDKRQDVDRKWPGVDGSAAIYTVDESVLSWPREVAEALARLSPVYHWSDDDWARSRAGRRRSRPAGEAADSRSTRSAERRRRCAARLARDVAQAQRGVLPIGGIYMGTARDAKTARSNGARNDTSNQTDQNHPNRLGDRFNK